MVYAVKKIRIMLRARVVHSHAARCKTATFTGLQCVVFGEMAVCL